MYSTAYSTQYLVRLGSVTPQPDKVRSEEEVVEAGVVTVVVTVPEQTDFRKIFSQIKTFKQKYSYQLLLFLH